MKWLIILFAGGVSIMVHAMPIGVRFAIFGRTAARSRESAPTDKPEVALDVHGGNWTRQIDGSWKSGLTADGTVNSISASVFGSGTVTFRWKTSCEDYFNFKGVLLRQDVLAFFVDGVETNFVNGIMSGWAECSLEIAGSGSHTLTWSYIKDASGAEGEDCAWLDAVSWVPSGTVVDVGGGKTVTVPQVWLSENTTRGATDTAANGRKVWECYVLGLDPENGDATNDFRIVSFPMKADGTPDIEHIVFDPPQARWNVPATYRVKGAANLSDAEWPEVTEGNKGLFRFFKVELVLP